MTALPEQMIDRWEHRADPAHGQDTVYWHVLMRDYPEVIALARQAQQRLADFPGLHMTPLEWLHMTTMVAGPAERFSPGQFDMMTKTAADMLAEVPPITVSLGRILYQSEAIMLGIEPATALAPIWTAAAMATNLATGDHRPESDLAKWVPHTTVCYSTAHQPAAPLIAALGENLARCEVQVRALSLVIQHGPERRWNWSTPATVRLVPTTVT